MAKQIPLNRGLFSLVDDEDYDRFSQFAWHVYGDPAIRTFYAKRESGGHPVLLHREITAAKDDEIVDHRDGNPLNNTRANLRICSTSQNAMNSAKRRNAKSSCYKGVHFHQGRKKYQSRITLNQKMIWIGHFNTEVEAAVAYDKKAIELFGEFARLNFPEHRDAQASSESLGVTPALPSLWEGYGFANIKNDSRAWEVKNFLQKLKTLISAIPKLFQPSTIVQ